MLQYSCTGMWGHPITDEKLKKALHSLGIDIEAEYRKDKLLVFSMDIDEEQVLTSAKNAAKGAATAKASKSATTSKRKPAATKASTKRSTKKDAPKEKGE